MYSLFVGLWKYLFSKNEYFVLILGLDNAGKTTLLEQIKTQYTKIPGLPSHKIVPTVGLNIARTQFQDIKLIYWDLGGQTQLRTIWNKFFSDVHAIIYVVDSNDKARFNESRDELETVIHDNKLKGVPLLLFFNKQDLPDSESIEFLSSIFKSVISSTTATTSKTDSTSTSLSNSTDEYNNSNNNSNNGDSPPHSSSLIRNNHLHHDEDSNNNENITRNVQLQSLIANKGTGLDQGITWLAECLRKNARVVEKSDF